MVKVVSLSWVEYLIKTFLSDWNLNTIQKLVFKKLKKERRSHHHFAQLLYLTLELVRASVQESQTNFRI